MTTASLDIAVRIARALGHPARLRAVAMLRSGELCVCQVTELLGLAPSTVSLHLRELRRCGIVSERKEGRWVLVRLSGDPRARRWVDAALATAAGDPRLEEDRRKVEEMRLLRLQDFCRQRSRTAAARSHAVPLNEGGRGREEEPK